MAWQISGNGAGRSWLPDVQESGAFFFFIPVSAVSRQKSFFAAWLRKTGVCGLLGSDFLFLRELESLPSEAFQHQGKFRLLRLRMFFQRRGGAQGLNKKRRRRCACAVSGDSSDRRKERFFAGGALCQTAFFRLLNPRRAFVLLEKRPYQGTPGKNRTAVF